jgi:hypothetical protein
MSFSENRYPLFRDIGERSDAVLPDGYALAGDNVWIDGDLKGRGCVLPTPRVI